MALSKERQTNLWASRAPEYLEQDPEYKSTLRCRICGKTWHSKYHWALKHVEREHGYDIWLQKPVLPALRKKGTTMAAAKTKKKSGAGADLLDIYEIAKKLGLPDYSDFEENNNEYVWESGNAYHQQAIADGASEEEAEEKRYRGEEEAQKELFSNWSGAVMRAAEEIWGFHHLKIDKASAFVSDVDYYIEPVHGKTWYDVAAEIARTINGVGLAHVPVEDYRRNSRQWVMKHLGSMQVQPEVYGTASAERIYEQSFR